MNRRFFSGIQDSYTTEHLSNTLVMTRILGFALDLGDNLDINYIRTGIYVTCIPMHEYQRKQLGDSFVGTMDVN